MRKPQGVASLALGYVLHWAFSPPLLNPKLELCDFLPTLHAPAIINHILLTFKNCSLKSSQNVSERPK